MKFATSVFMSSLLLATFGAFANGADAAGPGTGVTEHTGVCKAGVARVAITPQEPMWMAGYGARDRPAVGTIDKLVAHVRGAPEKIRPRKLRVVVFGAHPDDPESGCGGLIALLTKAGHEVVVGYSTCYRDGRKIGKEPEGVVRRREATAACRLLGAKPHFFDYAHEKLVADQATLEAVSAWLKQVKPDIVVTHWPLDTHPNHHVTSSLVWQSYLDGASWNLYFFEVMTDQQSLGFRPELYLDIGSVRALKKKALDCHRSQQPEEIWKVHDAMHRRRGAEAGVKYAEAYLLVERKKECPLLPVTFLHPKK